jgi:Fur family zinc uptake transcriptional regulator
MICEQMAENAPVTDRAVQAPPLKVYYDIAEARGLKWTPMRKEVFDLLWRSGGAWGPYDVTDALSGLGGRVFSNSIYRTLRTLEEFGLVVQVFTTRQYQVSPDPRLKDWGVLNCTICRSLTLIPLPLEAEHIRQATEACRFMPRGTIIECTGLCRSCAEVKAAEPPAPEKQASGPPAKTRESIRARLADMAGPTGRERQDD